MESYKKEFIEFMIESDVLTFGDFTTKSGRKTPFFINTGKYRTGAQIAKLGEFYAKAINEHFKNDAQVLFGPAYKGIPLVVTVSMAMAASTNDIAFCFNRKEAKDHGEGGSLVGHKLSDGEKVIIVEDVTTAGTSIYETVPVLKSAADVDVIGLIVSVDRMEKGKGEISAFEQIRNDFGMKTKAIVTLEEVVTYLHNKDINGVILINDEMKSRIDGYRAKYGA
jgi:orotate phosphoribosyltransferase